MLAQQPNQGRWVYSYSLSRNLFIDENNRIIDPLIDPSVSKLSSGPAMPVARNAVVKNVQQPVQLSQPAPRNAQQTVQNSQPAPRNVQQTIQNSQPVFHSANGGANQTQMASASRNAQRPVRNSQPAVRSFANSLGNNVQESRRTRSASVSSSGSTRSNISRRSNTSRQSQASKKSSSSNRNQKPSRYNWYYLNRDTVVRKGADLWTAVKENLSADEKILVDEANTVTIYWKDNLRKRIRLLKPVKGWITVETEQGKIYRKCATSLDQLTW